MLKPALILILFPLFAFAGESTHVGEEDLSSLQKEIRVRQVELSKILKGAEDSKYTGACGESACGLVTKGGSCTQNDIEAVSSFSKIEDFNGNCYKLYTRVRNLRVLSEACADAVANCADVAKALRVRQLTHKMDVFYFQILENKRKAAQGQPNPSERDIVTPGTASGSKDPKAIKPE